MRGAWDINKLLCLLLFVASDANKWGGTGEKRADEEEVESEREMMRVLGAVCKDGKQQKGNQTDRAKARREMPETRINQVDSPYVKIKPWTWIRLVGNVAAI